MPMPTMFMKSRESTSEGDKLGFVKLMVAGKSRVWHSRLIQDVFKWDGIVANDFEDTFLQEQMHPTTPPNEDNNSSATVDSDAEPRHIADDEQVAFHTVQDSGS
ncbi:hypothetical protein BGZ65_011970, partial [Modicella reniformis]